MQSIADATGGHSHPNRRRLVAGVGLVLAGAIIGGLGLAGMLGAATVRGGLAAVGLAVLVGWVALAARAPLNERERAIAAVGLLVGFAAVSIFWAVTPSDVAADPSILTILSGLAYMAAVTLVMAAVLAVVSVRVVPRSKQSNPSTTRWERTVGSNPPQHSTDGGEDEEELSFPLQDK